MKLVGNTYLEDILNFLHGRLQTMLSCGAASIIRIDNSVNHLFDEWFSL